MNTVLEIRSDLDHRISIDTTAGDLRLWDRIALRIGLALLLWGGRHNGAVDPAEAHRLMLARRTAERERDALLARSGLYRRP
ncbi:hypothetical protein [Naasia aerilata]|uniref:Uncharacterized protein n=1 Tax=Naasia aerilata TaxID=1162966 RepID=A0ABM8GE41_9MICO|nr:hypothetical protein [Naasia aerilata]BDZ46553.1 hypothetical protein GCM10025866_24620 [Naasia aerilata]